jgi:hypothetical protein
LLGAAPSPRYGRFRSRLLSHGHRVPRDKRFLCVFLSQVWRYHGEFLGEARRSASVASSRRRGFDKAREQLASRYSTDFAIETLDVTSEHATLLRDSLNGLLFAPDVLMLTDKSGPCVPQVAHRARRKRAQTPAYQS